MGSKKCNITVLRTVLTELEVQQARIASQLRGDDAVWLIVRLGRLAKAVKHRNVPLDEISTLLLAMEEAQTFMNNFERSLQDG